MYIKRHAGALGILIFVLFSPYPTLAKDGYTFTEKSLNLYMQSQMHSLLYGPMPSTEKLLLEAIKEDPSSWYLKYSLAEFHIVTGAFIKAKDSLESLRKQYSQNIDVRLLLAKVYTLLNYYEEAKTIYEEIIAIDKNHEEALFHVSLVYASKRDFKKSLAILKKLEEFSERLSLVYLYQARIYLELSDDTKAIAALHKAIDTRTEHPEAYLLLAALLESKGNRQEALKYYEEYSQINPEDRDVIKKLVDEYIADNNYEKALPMLNELHRLEPENHKVSLKIALIGIEYNRLSEARDMLEHILSLSPEMEIASYYLGMVCQIQQDVSCSQKAYGHVTQESPFYTEAVLQRAFIFIGLKQYDRAIAELTSTRDKDVVDENITLVTSAAYELKGDLKPATSVLEAFLKKDKSNVRVLYAKANILYKREKYNDAITSIRHLLEVDPNHVQGLNFLGYHLLTLGNSPKSAYIPLKRAYDLAPGDPYILDSWGWYWYVMEDLEQAFTFLQKAYILKQDDVTILEHLILSLMKKGAPHEARKYLEMSRAYYSLYTFEERRKLDELQVNIDAQARSLASE